MFQNSCLFFSPSVFINLYFTISFSLFPQIIWAHFYFLGIYNLNPQNITFKFRNQLSERIWTICLFRSGCPHSSHFSFFIHLYIDLIIHICQWLIFHCLRSPYFCYLFIHCLKHMWIPYHSCCELSSNEHGCVSVSIRSSI